MSCTFGIYLPIALSCRLSAQSLMKTLFFYLTYFSVFMVVTHPVFHSFFFFNLKFY